MLDHTFWFSSSNSSRNNFISSYNKSTSGGGLVLYITPNFINWNVHQIIPDTATTEEWNALTSYNGYTAYNTSSPSSSYTTKIANLLTTILKKYFRVLPNNNYLIMYPLPMYKGEDKTTMVKMYSPWSKDPLMTIKDPYDTTEEYMDKAIRGFTSYLTENGEIVLYYNMRPETPMILYNGRTMGTIESDIYSGYDKEIIDTPAVAKFYDKPDSTTHECTFSADGMEMDCAIGIMSSKNGSLTNDDIPAAGVTISFGDSGKTKVMNELNEYKKYDGISLYVGNSVDLMDDIDMDMSPYI